MARIDYAKRAPEGLAAQAAMERYVRATGLDRRLLELVRIRASQINRCAFCLDMHTKDARAAGESEQRLSTLSAWREAPFYSERERAALAWTEAVTRVSETGVPDELFSTVRSHFDEKELVALTFAVTTINTWNRLAVAFRPEVGTYRPRDREPGGGS